MTSDIIKEFTTEDGSRVIITKPAVVKQIKEEGRKVSQTLLKDNTSVSRFLKGLKLEMGDLTQEAKEKLKEEIKQEALNSIDKNKKDPGHEAKASNNGKLQSRN